MADRDATLSNLQRALAELESFAALPIQNRRDKAGLVQGFEFTFELFWKTFQKLAPEAGLDASSPREALSAGEKLRFIAPEDAPHWAQMLRDRNVTSHTYNAALTDEIVERLLRHYLPCYRSTIARILASS